MQEMITDLLRRWNLPAYAWNLIIIGSVIVLGLLIHLVLSLVVKYRNNSPHEGFIQRSFFRHLVNPVGVFIPLLVFDLLLPVLRMNSALRRRVDHAVEIFLIIAFAWMLVRTVRVLQEFIHNKVDIRSATDNLRQRRLLTQLMYIRRVINIIIVILAVGAVLLTFESMRKLGTGLLTGVGIGGIIIGFAAQKSLGNILAGFQIAFTQPMRIDDEVIVEGEFGIIEEITLTYVVVRIWDERRLILPINYFIEKPFQNWTRSTSAMHGTVFIYTDFGFPVDWLRAEFRRLVEAHPLWDKRTALLAVTDLKQNVMEIRLMVSGKKSGHVFDLRCHLREQLMKAIATQYPQYLPKTRALLNQSGEANETVAGRS